MNFIYFYKLVYYIVNKMIIEFFSYMCVCARPRVCMFCMCIYISWVIFYILMGNIADISLAILEASSGVSILVLCSPGCNRMEPYCLLLLPPVWRSLSKVIHYFNILWCLGPRLSILIFNSLRTLYLVKYSADMKVNSLLVKLKCKNLN